MRSSAQHAGCIWSSSDIKRVRKLIVEGRITEAGLAVLPAGLKE